MSAAPQRGGVTPGAAPDTASVVRELLARSNHLGSDPRVTNFGGGNTSAKVAGSDEITGQPQTLMYIKGSGGDLGTLTADGLSVLVVERLRALEGRYRGEQYEDEMVDLLDHCMGGGASVAPSIDTAMHGLLAAAHVDHLHPDAVIALAAAADGESLVKECFGDSVAWVPWRRPGFELGLEIRDLAARDDALRGAVLGGHGLTAWARTSAECEATSLELIARAEAFITAKGRPEPFGPVVEANRALAPEVRRARAAALGPVIRGLCSTDHRVVGHFRDDEVVLDFLARAGAPALVALGTSCPDHFLRTKVRPLLLDLPADAPVDAVVERLSHLHMSYREEYRAYYTRYATPESPPMRGADPAIVLIPGVGMWSFGADAQTARVAGEFYVNAIGVMRGAEAVSRYAPIPEAEKFRIEYWALEEAKLARRPKPRPLAGRVALVTGAGSGIGKAIAHRLSSEGAVVVVADINAEAAAAVAAEIGNADKALAVAVDVADHASIVASFADACAAYGGIDLVVNNAGLSISAPLLDTTIDDWDRQHAVMARGSFLVSQAAARVMMAQGMGGDIVYIVSKNAIFAGPNNLAYGAAKADQAHQVRLLAAELGASGIRVNGINPDAVVRGSGIFAGGWGKQRAQLYGVAEEDLGRFYAERTLLGTEVLPEHVAAAVVALTAGDLSLTTGTLVPVDGGVPAAFVR